MIYKIYTLTHPINKLIFYVGMTTLELEQRLMNHCYEHSGNPLNPRSAKNEIIIELAILNLLPLIEEIDGSNTDAEATQKEKYWIYQLNEWGLPITNKQVIGKREYELVITDNFPKGIVTLRGQKPPEEMVSFSKTRDRNIFNLNNPKPDIPKCVKVPIQQWEEIKHLLSEKQLNDIYRYTPDNFKYRNYIS